MATASSATARDAPFGDGTEEHPSTSSTTASSHMHDHDENGAAAVSLSDHDDSDHVQEEEEEDDTSGSGNPISLITEDMLASDATLHAIWADLSRNYYATPSWSPTFYIDLAYSGFVSVAYEFKSERDDGDDDAAPPRALLLPEIQRKYGALDFAKLHTGKKVRKRARAGGYQLGVNQDMEAVFRGVQHHHENNWLCHSYRELWRALHAAGPVPVHANGGKSRFHAVTIELLTHEGEVVAGEVGYILGSTYTSLTGFFSTEPIEDIPLGASAAATEVSVGDAGPAEAPVEGVKRKLKHSSAGKIQLVALGRFLERCGVKFWNLGHPPKMPSEDDPKGSMVYKAEIGGEILTRSEFLVRWKAARDVPLPNHTLPSGRFPVTELIEGSSE